MPDPTCQEIKMKSPKDLQRFLDVVRRVMDEMNVRHKRVDHMSTDGATTEEEEDDDEQLLTLRRIESVLTM